jgi:hypothetical protein
MNPFYKPNKKVRSEKMNHFIPQTKHTISVSLPFFIRA